MKHSIGGIRHVLLLQDTCDLIPRTFCYPPCCNSLCYCGLEILVLSSSNFWESATTLHLGWHAQPGHGSAGLSNQITTGPETCADCLKIVLGLTEKNGWGRPMCCSRNTRKAKSLWPRAQATVLLTKHQPANSLWPQTQHKTAEEKQDTETGQKQIMQFKKRYYTYIYNIENCRLLPHSLAA